MTADSTKTPKIRLQYLARFLSVFQSVTKNESATLMDLLKVNDGNILKEMTGRFLSDFKHPSTLDSLHADLCEFLQVSTWYFEIYNIPT